MSTSTNAADVLATPGPRHAAPARRRTRLTAPLEIKSGRRSQRIAALDGLRLLAALMVVAYHYIALSWPWSADGSNSFPGSSRSPPTDGSVSTCSS
ncbi:hypothetical protein [Streptomyces rimosus]|uniref:hypothetical protein n=1 Tax=Streptomyces rimosus TaxID=1927 RepID=UPI00210027A1|nr:hypothetical protein [Streptomyces rimosus]